MISGADISINTGNGKASLTLKDSRPTANHTNSSLPSGGVVTSKISMKQDGGSYNDCVLYANGGTVTSEFNTNTNAVAIKCTSNTPTAFTGKISGYWPPCLTKLELVLISFVALLVVSIEFSIVDSSKSYIF